jgi:hypothetical protein
MRLFEFAASVVGSAVGATAVLALFIKATHALQSRAAVALALKSFTAKSTTR